MGNDLKIFADATISSGSYDKVKVFGSADVTGDVDVLEMKVFGDADFTGKCTIGSLKVFGSCSFKQYAEVTSMNIKGSCDFDEDVKVDYLKVYGEVTFKKNMFKAEEINVYGQANVTNLEANSIKIHGYVECKEQLNGEVIEISTNNGSKINEMVGTRIEVKPPKNNFFNLIKDSKQIMVDTIEGDEIYLENVTAKAVRGNKIKIGPKCEIDHIDYHDNCEVSSNSNVKKVDKY